MKKIISLIIILVIIAIGLTIGNCSGSGEGGDGSGSGSGDGTENVATGDSIENDTTDDEYKGAIYAITVVESDYFYNNDRIEIDDIVDMLEAVDGEFVVEIKEDNASLKAYNKLVEKLEEIGAAYVEK